MRFRKYFNIILFCLISAGSFSQEVFLTRPRLAFAGDQLLISYDIIAADSTDRYFVWVEVIDDHQKTLEARSASGDIGQKIEAGYNKQIIWTPEKDSLLLNKNVFVRVKAERLIKTYDRSSMLLKSVVLPGWGQTKVSNGKPWWLSSIVAYGLMAGSYIYHSNYHKSYRLYRIEEDPQKRTVLFRKSQNSLDISTAMLYTSLSVWISNLIWIAVVPEKYRPLQNANLSFDMLPACRLYPGSFLTLRIDF